ncbi:hypothetical protein [Micromonospora sp. NBC_01412]|uniref:hypothetical protein n=1 Tax=Micromonospora sp. NBC_01412 TaxID=2903590 RepID=UPI0032451503
MERCRNCHPFWNQKPFDVNPAAAPEGRIDQIEAIDWLRYSNLGLRKVDAKAVRELTRKFFNSGWSPNDITYALGHEPDGAFPGVGPQPHDPADRVHSWLRQRLNSWCDSDREPLLSVSQLRLKRAEAMKAAQQQRARELREQAEQVAPTYAASTSGARAVAVQAAMRGRTKRREAEIRAQNVIAEEIAEQRSAVTHYTAALDRMSELAESERNPGGGKAAAGWRGSAAPRP